MTSTTRSTDPSAGPHDASGPGRAADAPGTGPRVETRQRRAGLLGLWLAGMARRRAGRLAATATGIAVCVALIGALGAFLAGSRATMTARALRSVAVDWQVELQPAADPAAVVPLIRSAPGVRAAASVGFARTTGLSAAAGGTTQTTGPGVVLGLPPGYASLFPGEIRPLAGAASGVLLAQQTAANLHVRVGDAVTIGRAGAPSATVRIAGVVDLPQADSLFQKVGAPPGSQPSAPPDNVVLLPSADFAAFTRPVATVDPGAVRTQVHVGRDSGALSPDPATAYTQVVTAAHNLEARAAGAAIVGNNLGAALDGARKDAAYAQVLFLFLGVPGAVLAALLAATVSAAGGERRRQEQALLRTRGLRVRQVLGLAGAEAAVTGVLGAAAGIAGAWLAGRLVSGTPTSQAAVGPFLVAAVAGVAVAAVVVLIPAARDLRRATVHDARREVGRAGTPWWQKVGLDVALITAALLVFWASGSDNYSLVLAPEGVATISVSYWAFLGPALLWLGAALLAWRLVDLALRHGRRALGVVVRPLTGRLASTTAASMSRRRAPLARAAVLLALAISFAASTATFNATYRQQAEADAQLTNGADVTVTQSPGTVVGPDAAGRLAAVPGVRSVEPMQHRFAYVGSDLQDLYGVDPSTITRATSLQDAYFVGGSARQLMSRLTARPDSILVSDETVKDFQLSPGDLLRLRLPDGRTGRLITVDFHYAGIVKEFPTAPRDSFFVANAAYVATATGSPAIGAFLVDTGGSGQVAVARQLRALLGTSATVTDVTQTRSTVGSSLTSVDLAGLTRVELAFAVLLAAGAGAIVLALGVAERRRTFAIGSVLGATRRQLRGMVLSEAGVVTVVGIAAGGLTAWALSVMLVKVLTGVFDPPPATIPVPWSYIVAVITITTCAIATAALLAARQTRRPAIEELREL